MQRIFKKLPYFLCILLSGMILLSGCAIHRPVIQQGQITDPENLEQLEVGMTQDEVQAILGTPLVVDSFNQDRWDYVLNIIGKQRTIIQRERVTVFFEDGVLSRIETIKPIEESEAETQAE